MKSDPDRIRTVRRELSTEYTHSEWDNIMESSSRGRDAGEQHDHQRELKEKKKVFLKTFVMYSYVNDRMKLILLFE